MLILMASQVETRTVMPLPVWLFTVKSSERFTNLFLVAPASLHDVPGHGHWLCHCPLLVGIFQDLLKFLLGSNALSTFPALRLTTKGQDPTKMWQTLLLSCLALSKAESRWSIVDMLTLVRSPKEPARKCTHHSPGTRLALFGWKAGGALHDPRIQPLPHVFSRLISVLQDHRLQMSNVRKDLEHVGFHLLPVQMRKLKPRERWSDLPKETQLKRSRDPLRPCFPMLLCPPPDYNQQLRILSICETQISFPNSHVW